MFDVVMQITWSGTQANLEVRHQKLLFGNRSRFVERSFDEGRLVSRKILKPEAHVAPLSTPLRMPPK